MNRLASKKLGFLFTLSLMNSVQAQQQIILWDIHGVLLTRSGVANTLWKYEDWWNLITHTSFGLIKDLLVLGVKNLFTPMSSEQYIALAQQHNNPYLEKLIIQLTNSQKPMPGMKEILQALDQAGHEQHVASNIGRTAFLALTNSNTYPDLAPLFEHINIEKSYVVSGENDLFFKKPDHTFFKEYLQKNSIDPQETSILFIDNKKNNIKAAQQVGLATILFKNSEQLKDELKKLKIDIN